MGYGQILQMIMGIVGTAMASNQADNAREGFEAQMNKWKKYEPHYLGAPETVDWRNVLNTVLGQNIESSGRRHAFGASENKFRTGEANKMYKGIQPYYDQLQNQIGQNALSFSKGELPPDVVSSIGRAAAQRGIEGGFAGAGAQPGSALGNLNLRNLGLTSLELSKYGTNTAMQANQMAKYLSPGLFDASFLMANPGQILPMEQWNAGQENQFDILNNDIYNSAQLTNTKTANEVLQLIAGTKYSNRMTKAEMYQQLGQSGGGMMGGSGGGGGGGGGGSGGFMNLFNFGNTTSTSGVPNAGHVQGYGYSPNTGYSSLI